LCSGVGVRVGNDGAGIDWNQGRGQRIRKEVRHIKPVRGRILFSMQLRIINDFLNQLNNMTTFTIRNLDGSLEPVHSKW
jgi:hypothetical protein